MTFLCPVSHICETLIFFFSDHHSNPGVILDGERDKAFQNSKILNSFKLYGFDFKQLTQSFTIFGSKFLHLNKEFFEQKIYF